MFDLSGKTALVTGASGGIGGAIARALHQQGAAVLLSGTRQGALEALAVELATRGITVNCVAPGFIASAMTDALTPEQKERIAGTIPMGRLGAPEDVAATVVFLASDQAGYITGQTLHVNGGMAMI